MPENDGLPLSQVEDLEEYEEGREFREESMEGVELRPLLLPTLEDAQRAAKRVATLRKKVHELSGIYDAEEKAILADLEACKQRRVVALKPYERRMGWYLFAMEEFHRARLQADPKEKTLRLPAGDMVMRNQQPEWVYGNESLTIDELRYARPDLIRAKWEIDKSALKKAAVVEDGYAFIVTKDGEKRQLPLQVVERLPKFDFKPA